MLRRSLKAGKAVSLAAAQQCVLTTGRWLPVLAHGYGSLLSPCALNIKVKGKVRSVVLLYRFAYQFGGSKGIRRESEPQTIYISTPRVPRIPPCFSFEPRRSRAGNAGASKRLPEMGFFENYSHLAGISAGILNRVLNHPVMVCRRRNFPVFLPRIFR